LEELVVTGSVAAEIAELVELRKGCSNCGLSVQWQRFRGA
jgi:hypothetical protein